MHIISYFHFQIDVTRTLYILNVFKIQILLINLKHSWHNILIYLQKLKFKKLELGQWVWGISHNWIGYLELSVCTRCLLNHHLIWSQVHFQWNESHFTMFTISMVSMIGSMDLELIQSETIDQNFIIYFFRYKMVYLHILNDWPKF